MTLQEKILSAIAKTSYQPVKPKILAKRLGVAPSKYTAFRKVLKELCNKGRIEFGKNHSVRPVQPHGTCAGVFRKTADSSGFVRPTSNEEKLADIFIPEKHTLDASTGDEVLVRIRRKPKRPDFSPTGEVLQVLERATRQFVGTYFERDDKSYVRVDGTVFSHSVYVGDPGAKNARPGDKVVIEMLRFPTQEDRRGEGVITEILGKRGEPGVDTLSIIHEYGLPTDFPEETLEDARDAAAAFDENDLVDREDFTNSLTITVDPADARDFDDAVSLSRDPDSGHWELAVHIADVEHFVSPGGWLDREARRRGTSVYLPQRVIPMFPEIISNSLASLQEGKLRYVKSVLIEFAPEGQVVSTRFANGAIRVRRRFTYEEVSANLNDGQPSAPAAPKPASASPRKQASKKKRTEKKPTGPTADTDRSGADDGAEIGNMLVQMRELAMILRGRRFRNGALELEMPDAQLEYDNDGRVTGAHFAKHDVSHQIIEEFMLAANQAVAQHITDLGVACLRRIHPSPLPSKLQAFAEFARILGYKIKSGQDRFALQRVLKQSAQKPDKNAVHYALLRSLKQAVYSPREEGHYALAIDNYCHFTSPIRRYPDLIVHRQISQWLRTGHAGSDETELTALGDHCSKKERRAALAERELIKVKLLTYMSERIGTKMEAIITGVADYGFFAQAEKMPVEGLVHIDTLSDDYYYFEEASHSLTGRKTKKRYRLGDKVKVAVVRVDLSRRQLDFRVVVGKKK